MKKYITGGMREHEARDMLLKRGVQAFKALAGSLPQKEPVEHFDDLPLLWLDSINHGTAWYRAAYHTPRVQYGRLIRVILRLDMCLCWSCSYAITDYLRELSPTLQFYGNVSEGYCEICGEWEKDDIPF